MISNLYAITVCVIWELCPLSIEYTTGSVPISITNQDWSRCNSVSSSSPSLRTRRIISAAIFSPYLPARLLADSYYMFLFLVSFVFMYLLGFPANPYFMQFAQYGIFDIMDNWKQRDSFFLSLPKKMCHKNIVR